MCVTTPNFVKITQTVGEMSWFKFFFKLAAVRHLGLLGAYLDHPWRVLGGLYLCVKFGWNRCSSFDNMRVLIFCALGLKMPIHSQKMVFGGNGGKRKLLVVLSLYECNIAGLTTYESNSVKIACVVLARGVSKILDHNKAETTRVWYFTHLSRSTSPHTWAIAFIFGMLGDIADIITHAKNFVSIGSWVSEFWDPQFSYSL